MFSDQNPFHLLSIYPAEGVTFHGELNLRSAQLNYDWFPFGGAFHLSPGMLVYNGTKLIANLSIPSGRVLHSGANNFRSDPADPIRGNASITFRKFAPAFLLGWCNLIPRKPLHFSIPCEFGVVFHGQPDLSAFKFYPVISAGFAVNF